MTKNISSEYPLFQPSKKVFFDADKKIIKLEFDEDELVIPQSVPQINKILGAYKEVMLIEKFNMIYNEKLKLRRAEFSEPRCIIGSGIVPIINDKFTIIQFRPFEYVNYPGKLAFAGGILETKMLPFENAKKEFCEETILYNFKEKILYTANFCSEDLIDSHIKLLESHDYAVRDVEKFSVKFIKLDNMYRIIAKNNHKTEESYGYVFRKPMGSRIEIHYIANIKHNFDLNNIISIPIELGGELSFITPLKELMLSRESYFVASTEYVLKKLFYQNLFT